MLSDWTKPDICEVLEIKFLTAAVRYCTHWLWRHETDQCEAKESWFESSWKFSQSSETMVISFISRDKEVLKWILLRFESCLRLADNMMTMTGEVRLLISLVICTTVLYCTVLYCTFNTHGVRTYDNISQVQSVLCQDSSLFNGSYSSPLSPVMTRHSNSWTVFLLLVKLPQLAVRVLQGDEHDVLSCQARLSVLRVGKLGIGSLWPVADPGHPGYKWFRSKPHLVISTLCQN